MSKYVIQGQTLTDIANAIRNKTKSTDTLSAGEMASAINGIDAGTDTSDATASTDEIFAGETAYTADGKVTGTFTIDTELTTQDDLIGQIKTIIQTKANPQGGIDTSDATATESDILSGKTAYVNGEKIIGNIPSKTSSDLTVSGATVSVPAGHYTSQATKSVSTGSAKTPTTTITKTPTISVNSSGLITASVSGTQSVTPTVTAGYVSGGTAGTITVSGSATKQLTTKAATTYTPTTSNQTIASGTYLTGTQTIKGDSNLKAENIASGVSIFGVTGTHSGSEDLNTELTEQENLISQLSTILDNKASGGSGGSLESYTVSITCNDESVLSKNITVLYCKSDGSVETTAMGSASITLNNVHGLLVIYSFSSGVVPNGGSINEVYSNGYEVIVYDVNCNGTINIM